METVTEPTLAELPDGDTTALEALGENPTNEAIIDASDGHDYWCRCALCKVGWKLTGRDTESQTYGPFTDEEIQGAGPA